MEDQASRVEANVRRVSVKNLFLDPNNYRIIHEEEQVEVDEMLARDKIVAQRTLRLVAGEKNQHIQDLIDSFKANGYLPVDQIQVKELDNGGYLVIEGNRRVTALKQLLADFELKNIDLGALNPEIFSRVPVVLYTDADEMHHLTLMALKHISGNKKWGEWNQAKLLEKMQSMGVPEDEIVKKIGISKVELRRSLRALSLVQQYRTSDYGDQFTESKFPIFRQVVRSSALKKWLDWDEELARAKNPSNADLFFSWLSKEPLEEEDDNGYAGFGEKYLDPAITKRDDIDVLAKIVTDTRALEQLKATRDLNAAFRASDLIFRERHDAAIKSVSLDISTLTQLAIGTEYLPELENALGRLTSVVQRAKSLNTSGLVVDQRAVFHDRIDFHFSEVVIHEYKCLRNLRLSGLKRINVFAGLNNAGKTTLLEALYLLARQNDFSGILDVTRRRGKFSEDRIDAQWMVEQIEQKLSIAGTFDSQVATVELFRVNETDPNIDRSKYVESVRIQSTFGPYSEESNTRLFKGRDFETQADSIKLLCPAVFSSPFFLNEPHRYTQFYHKSTQSKSLERIFSFLRKYVLPTLVDIRLTDERQRFVVNDSRFEVGVDLTSYGEGLQRIFFIALLFASASNGILLIDEMENAIHADLIVRFAPFLDELAKDYNVQVFVTSHSKECIDSFIQDEKLVENFSFHALVREDGIVESRDFDGKNFMQLVVGADVDLRRAV